MARDAELADLRAQLRQAEARAQRAEADVREWQMRYERRARGEQELDDELERVQHRLEAAEAQCAALREALEQVQWEHTYVDLDNCDCSACPACHARPHQHDPDCPIGQALATDAGAALLAEVKRLREFHAKYRYHEEVALEDPGKYYLQDDAQESVGDAGAELLQKMQRLEAENERLRQVAEDRQRVLSRMPCYQRLLSWGGHLRDGSTAAEDMECGACRAHSLCVMLAALDAQETQA